jgi:MscS family membrane protein
MISACIIFGAWFLSLLITTLLWKILSKIQWKEERKVQLHSILAPSIRFLMMIAGIWFTSQVLDLPQWLVPIVSRIMRTLVLFGIFGALYRGAELFSEFFNSLLNRSDNYVEMLLPMLRKSIKVIIVLLGAITILEDWGYDVAGILAGLGLGGLALALAAKDTAANFFGGVALMLEHPFVIGDWIATDQVEGVVEELGIRSTKIRTFAQAQVTVPNSTLAAAVITNWSRMGKRRYTFKLRVAYQTKPEKLQELIANVRTLLRNQPGIHPETIFVYFNSFGDSALEILIYCFTKTTNWNEYLQIVHEINTAILTMTKELDVEIAYPTHTVHMVQADADTLNSEDPRDEFFEGREGSL